MISFILVAHRLLQFLFQSISSSFSTLMTDSNNNDAALDHYLPTYLFGIGAFYRNLSKFALILLGL